MATDWDTIRPGDPMPATLSTPDDVARVCEAAGLTESVVMMHRIWSGAVEVRAWPNGWHVSGPFVIEARWGTPAVVLTAAIEAARTTAERDTARRSWPGLTDNLTPAERARYDAARTDITEPTEGD